MILCAPSSGIPCPASNTIVFPDTGKTTVSFVSSFAVVNINAKIEKHAAIATNVILFLFKTTIKKLLI